MNAPPKFIVGYLDGTPVVVTEAELEAGVAFDVVHGTLTEEFDQAAPQWFPARPSGQPRLIAAGERVPLFRCELRALQAAGAINVLDRLGSFRVIDAQGRSAKILVGDLIDAIVSEVKAALLDEGFISQADIGA